MLANPLIWFQNRELTFVPSHFIKCPTPVIPDAKLWIYNKISGRFCLVESVAIEDFLAHNEITVYFENEQDATLYELIWAGSSK